MICRIHLLLCFLLPTSSVCAHAQSFGGAVAVTDKHIFIGETTNVAYLGEVYVYQVDDPTQKPTILSVNRELERFGRSIAVRDRTLFIAAHESNESRGVVYVFRYNEIWELVDRLTASDAMPDDQFGFSLGVENDHILIGAPGRSESEGAVYAFREHADGSFSESAILTVNDPTSGNRFGSTLSIEEDLAVISALPSPDRTSLVYVFERTSNQWKQTAQLIPDFLEPTSRMGSSVMVDQGRIYVGAPNHNQRTGIVLIYELDLESKEIQIRHMLQPPTQYRSSQFGASLASSDNELWIGANRNNQGRGAVHRYLLNDDRWISTLPLQPDESIGRAAFGSRIAVHRDLAVVGAVRMDSRAGGAVVIKRVGDDWISSMTLINDVKSHQSIRGREIQCNDGFVSRWPCSNVDLTAFVPLPEMGGKRGTRLNDIWGWTDPVTSREYALVGRNDGTSFIDITNPEYPRYLGDLPMTTGSVANVWRDVKVYADHAYVVADGAGQHGVQVFDLTQLRDVEDAPITFEETAIYPGIASAHNIVINEETGFGFVVGANSGGETCGGGLHMLDLRQPAAPSFAGCFADPNTGRTKTGYSHDAQCVIYSGPDIQYSGREICLGSNETAMSIADVTDKENPVAISVASYPKVAYTHQGWLTEDHRYFYMNDEGDEPQGLVDGTRTLVWDVSDLDDPILVNEYIASTTDTDHNLYIKGDLMYQSNYGAGLRILDISNRENPVEIGFFEPGPGSSSWSNYPYFKSETLIVTSGTEGLFVLKKRELDI